MSKGHWCLEHETVFFKKGKMKNFAHPIEENGQTVGWCNEPEEGGAEEPEETRTPYKADPDKTSSIERQVALKTATELAVAGKIEREQLLLHAELHRRYLAGELTFPPDIEKVMAQYVGAIVRKETQ